MKKTSLKRILALLMAGTMVFSLASCGEKTDDDTSGDSSSGDTSSQNKDNKNMDGDIKLNEPGEFPLIDGDPITFSAFISPQLDTCSDFDRQYNSSTEYIEDKLNVRFDFEVTSKADKKTRLNLMFTTDDYPDLIFGSGWDGASLFSYGKAGYIVPLDQYFEKEAHYFDEYVDYAKEVDDGTITDSITASTVMPDGHTYSLYRYNSTVHTKYINRMWINSNWLQAVDMEMPTTTDEFYDVLTAFKEKDPNGNGKNDEVPLAGAFTGWSTNPRMFLMNSFCYYPGVTQFHSYVDDGEIKIAPMVDGYREGLEYLHKLTEDGLLTTESWTQDTAMLKTLSSQDQLGTVFNGGHAFTIFTNGQPGDWTKWITVDPLQGPEAVQYAHYTPSNPVAQFQITDNCKYPKLAFRVGDAFYETENSYTISLGAKGTYWDYAKEGDIGLDGEPAKLTKNHEAIGSNYCWGATTHASNLAGWHTGMTVYNDPAFNTESMYYAAAKSYSKYSPEDDMILPQFVFDDDVAQDVVDMRADLNVFIDEKEVQFIINGVTEETWKAYQDELVTRGAEKLVKIYQDAYDAMQ